MKRSFIPDHKADMQAVEALERTEFEVVKPFVTELLEWVQDVHWQVARPIAKYLRPYLKELTQELIVILKSEDILWKQAAIALFLAEEECSELAKPILDELSRIAYLPSFSEWEESIDDAALFVLEGFDSETATVLSFSFDWEASSVNRINVFWELLESCLMDYDITKIVRKGNQKGKIRKIDSPYDMHSLRGLLFKVIRQVDAELPGILLKTKTAFQLQ